MGAYEAGAEDMDRPKKKFAIFDLRSVGGFLSYRLTSYLRPNHRWTSNGNSESRMEKIS
jgi:hypothetical protein